MRPTVRESTGALFMLRCAELGLSDEALDGMTMGWYTICSLRKEMMKRSIHTRQPRMIYMHFSERGK